MLKLGDLLLQKTLRKMMRTLKPLVTSVKYGGFLKKKFSSQTLSVDLGAEVFATHSKFIYLFNETIITNILN